MFQTIVVFECRGLEPVEFDPRVKKLGQTSGIEFFIIIRGVGELQE